MPAYRFEALDATGRTSTGLIEADNAKAARAQLRAQKLVPLEVGVVVTEAAESASRWALRRRVFGTTGLALWTRQLAGLVTSGLPLERALTALSDEAEDERQRELVAHLRSEVNAGSSFAKALGTAPREFDDIYRAVVAAGEQSGNLGLVLEKLADDLEERQALRGKLVSAALYPAIVSMVAVVIVIFLVTYVVPQVASVFSGTKQTLPFLTVAMLAISGFVRQWGWLTAAVIGAGLVTLSLMLRNEAFRERFDAAWLGLPIVGRRARGYKPPRVARTRALLGGAGVPLRKAQQAADALDALVQVREGAPLAAALAGKKRFPGLLAMFSRLGEQTGTLPRMLERAAGQLGQEVQRRALQMATILEPLLIVVMGIVVMLIVLAVLLPIIQLNSWVR